MSYPSSFRTTSRVAILTNSWESINEHFKAVEGRLVTIAFEPSVTEVHLEIGRGGWFHYQEIYDFIWDQCKLIPRPKMRVYNKLVEQKKARRPWRIRAIQMLIGDERLQRTGSLASDRQRRSLYISM